MGCIRSGSSWRWPSAVIPYAINDEDFPDTGTAERAAIEAALDVWREHTQLQFPLHHRELNWVEFVAATEEDACSSHVGMKRRRGEIPVKQEIPCNPLGTALVHAIGHAVGLWHEQQREDRDTNITVDLENVRSDKRGNFDRHVDDGEDIGGYDYDSVMHYSPRTFAVDWPLGTELPGQSSSAAPALASAGGELHLLHLGNGSQDIFHTWSTDGTAWTVNRVVPNQTSKAVPALAAFNGALHMVHLGHSSNDIWHSSSTDLRTWIDNTRADQKSKAAPALAEFNSEMHMVHICDESNDLWHAWTTDGTLHMVHLGNSSNDLWHTWTSDGRTWTTNERIEDQRSQATPALAAFGAQLHLAHIADSSSTIWHSTFGGSTWVPNDRRDNNQTSQRPALAEFMAELHMVYLGTSGREIRHTVRDRNLRTFDVPGPQTPGTTPNTLSAGDLEAVKVMYPSPRPRVMSIGLEATLHMMMPAVR